MTSQEIIKMLEQTNQEFNSRIIKDIITDHRTTHDRALKLYNYYKGEVDIKNRAFVDTTKVNNKLNNDYFGDIIDQIVGYMFGESISYQIDKTKYSGEQLESLQKFLDEWRKYNNIEDLDSETGEKMSICGYAGRLCYVDERGRERLMNLSPEEVVFIRDSTTNEMQYAMVYYPLIIRDGDNVKTRIRVEWYDKQNVTFYVEGENGEYELDATETTNPLPHLFDRVPVIEFPNNNIRMGDFEKIESLVNAMDRTLSDMQNEIEEFRLAYLCFYGAEPSKDTLEEARKLGAIHFPEGTDGKYLTKQIADQFIENHKNTLNNNIYRFSKSVDTSDEKFSGSAMTGESRKWKLVPLEQKAIVKERKFTKGLREMFGVLCSAWNKKSIPLKPEDIIFQFKRNIPIDLLYEADVQIKLQGVVDDETRLALASFIDSPEKVIAKMKEENPYGGAFDNLDKEVNPDKEEIEIG